MADQPLRFLGVELGARMTVVTRVEKKRPDLIVADVLGESRSPIGRDVLDQALIAGFPITNEVVFFHRPSGTLIASDLVFNVGSSSPALTRLVFRSMGAYGRPASTVFQRLLIRDRAAFRRSLERILSWPISRIILAHGSVIEREAHTALVDAYSWVVG